MTTPEGGRLLQPWTMSRRRFLSNTLKVAGGSIAVTSAAALLTGCEREPDVGALRFWQFYGPDPEEDDQGPESQWFLDLVTAWNEENEPRIDLQFVPGAEYIGGGALARAFAAAEGPDIFLISPGDFLRYQDRGDLLDLTPFIDDEARGDFFPDVLATREVDDRVYGVPMEVEPMAMYYSVQAFEDAGLSEADIPTTWDQLIDVADQLRTEDRFGVLFHTSPDYYQNFTWYPFMWQGGGDAIDIEARASTFLNDATIDALAFWQRTIEEGVAPREYPGTGGFDIGGNLGEGFTAMQNCGIWAVAELDALGDLEYGVFPLPIPDGGENVSVGGGWAFVANANGRDPEAAGNFIAWAMASMEEDSVERGLGWNLETKTNMPARQSVMERAEQGGYFDDGPLQVFRDDVVPTVRGEPRYPPGVYRPISDAIQAAQLGGADPAQAAERAHEEIDSFLVGYPGSL